MLVGHRAVVVHAVDHDPRQDVDAQRLAGRDVRGDGGGHLVAVEVGEEALLIAPERGGNLEEIGIVRRCKELGGLERLATLETRKYLLRRLIYVG